MTKWQRTGTIRGVLSGTNTWNNEKKHKARVQLLEKPFGITEPQSLEPYSNAFFYNHDNLFKTDVIPFLVLGKSNRRKIKYTYTLWRYITMNVMLW